MQNQAYEKGTDGCIDVTFVMHDGCKKKQAKVGDGPLSAVKLYPFSNSANNGDLCVNNNVKGCCTATGAYMAILTETVTCDNTDYLLVATAAVPVPMVRTQSISSFEYDAGSPTSSYIFKTCLGTTSLYPLAAAVTAKADEINGLQDPQYIVTRGMLRKIQKIKSDYTSAVEGVGCKLCPTGASYKFDSSTETPPTTKQLDNTCIRPILWDAWKAQSQPACYLMTSPAQVLIYVECGVSYSPNAIRRFRFFSCIEESDYNLRVSGRVILRYLGLGRGASTIDVVSCGQYF